MSDPPDTRPPFVVAMELASRIMTIAGEMAIPGLIGYLVDQKLGTKIVFTAAGVTAGFSLGVWHLVRLANPSRRNARRQDDAERKK